MTALAKTVQEARDQILERINALDSTSYQAIVLAALNDAVAFVSTFHDWEFLRKKATLTMPDATGAVTLPSDLDRILGIHSSGATYFLVKVTPTSFMQEKEEAALTESAIYCVTGYTQASTDVPPAMDIEIYPAPAAGTEFTLWYIKSLDELTTADLSTVPPLPPYIWNLVMRKAQLDVLRMQEHPPTTIGMEEKQFITTLDVFRRREALGSTRYGSMGHDPYIASYFKTRGRTR